MSSASLYRIVQKNFRDFHNGMLVSEVVRVTGISLPS